MVAMGKIISSETIRGGMGGGRGEAETLLQKCS